MRGHRSATALALLTLAAGVLALLVLPSSIPAESRTRPTRTTATTTTTTAPPATTAPLDVATEVVVEPAPEGPLVVSPRKVMLIGDSMAFTAALGLAPHGAAHGFAVVNEGINGCGVVRGGPYRYFGAGPEAGLPATTPGHEQQGRPQRRREGVRGGSHGPRVYRAQG